MTRSVSTATFNIVIDLSQYGDYSWCRNRDAPKDVMPSASFDKLFFPEYFSPTIFATLSVILLIPDYYKVFQMSESFLGELFLKVESKLRSNLYQSFPT